MEHSRPHRTISGAEVGFADAAVPHTGRHAVVHSPAPAWLLRYEDKRPRALMECIAEFAGTFCYVYLGVGATFTWNITRAAQLTGYGQLLNIALACPYGLGIAFGIIVSSATSGSHLSPGYTIAFALFKGFPMRKVPQYIVSQILGAFVAALLAYAQFGQQARQVVFGLNAFGVGDSNFTANGPAGALAIFPVADQSLGLAFLNELAVTTLLAIIVFSVLDASNFMVALASAPYTVGFAYTAIILAFAVPTVALNTARDLGGRFACGVIYGKQCFPMQFSALSALTNILGSILGAAIQVFLLSDHRRMMINIPPGHSIGKTPQEIEQERLEQSNGNRDLHSDAPYEKTNGINGHHGRTGPTSHA